MDNWANDLAEKHSKINKVALARTDMSLGPLNDLATRGYIDVEWKTVSPIPCQTCQDLEMQRWELTMFLSGLAHSAPVFEHSHVNCYCTVIIRGPGLPDVVVNSEGIA